MKSILPHPENENTAADFEIKRKNDKMEKIVAQVEELDQ